MAWYERCVLEAMGFEVRKNAICVNKQKSEKCKICRDCRTGGDEQMRRAVIDEFFRVVRKLEQQ